MPSSLEISFRHSGWARTRARVREALRRQGASSSRIERFDACGSNAWVARDACDPDRLAVVCSTCRDRWCLKCQQARSRIIATNLATAMEHCDCRMITLTLKAATGGLRQQVDRLLRSFAKLRRHQRWVQAISGGAAFLEITTGSTGDTWHVHLHAICFGCWIPQQWLRSAWHTITGDSFIVDVRAIGRGLQGAGRAVSYVTKYASKGLNVCKLRTDEQLDEAMLALKGRRLVIPFGDWHDARLSERRTETIWRPFAPLHRILMAAADDDAAAVAVLAQLRPSTACDRAADADVYGRPPPTGPTS